MCLPACPHRVVVLIQLGGGLGMEIAPRAPFPSPSLSLGRSRACCYGSSVTFPAGWVEPALLALQDSSWRDLFQIKSLSARALGKEKYPELCRTVEVGPWHFLASFKPSWTLLPSETPQEFQKGITCLEDQSQKDNGDILSKAVR